MMNRKSILRARREEIGNAVTHGIGTGLSVAGLVILIVFASLEGSVWHVISFAIFGAMMVLLYLASTIYHSIRERNLKKLFKKLDHMAIFLLIAGTYTPYCLTVLTGYWRWATLGIVWGGALLGVIFKIFYTGKKETLSTILYILLGWIALVVIHPLYEAMSIEGFILLIGGGLLYTAGTLFYIKEKLAYNHMIWHLFVMSGTTLHFFSVLTLL